MLDIESAPDKPLARDAALESIKGLSRGFQGRPLALTDSVATNILSEVRNGSFLTVACAKAGVAAETVYEWLRRGVADKQAGLDTIFGRFTDAHTRAQAEHETSLVATLSKGGEGKYPDWRAQAFVLERRHKERWSLPKEQANQGLTLQLSNEALAALVDALRVGAATNVTPQSIQEDTPQQVVVTKENV
jgi:hypothetical protein